MIEYIRGRVETLNPAAAVVETGSGVAYLIHFSLPTFTELQGREHVRLWVHEVIREDAWLLYGFSSERERELFRLLIGVSGVGASTALIILSAMTPGELSTAVASDDVKRLKAIKGIGAKTAERIIVDLRDKIKAQGDSLPNQGSADSAQPTTASRTMDEARAALLMLGFERKATDKVLKALFDAEPAMQVEEAVRKALPRL